MTWILFTCASLATVVLLIWVGYPVMMGVLAQAIGRPCQPALPGTALSSVSVVLATREGVETALARVANLFETEHPGELLEVIVVRDASSSVEWPVAPFDDSRVKVIDGDLPGGKAAALNAGARAASGDILIMADSAQRFDRQTIPALVAALEDRRFGAVSGALGLGQDHGVSPVHWYWRWEKWLRYSESRVHSAIGVTGAVYGMRRALWTAIPDGTLLDDVFVPMSLVLRGHRIGFTYAARAFDVRTFASGAEASRKTRTLTGVLQLLELLPDILSSRNPVRVQFIMHKLARLATPLLLALMVPLAALLLLGVLRAHPRLGGAGIAATLLVLTIIPSLRRASWSAVKWGFEMQRATVAALTNGFRRNWTVWNSPS